MAGHWEEDEQLIEQLRRAQRIVVEALGRPCDAALGAVLVRVMDSDDEAMAYAASLRGVHAPALLH